MKYCEECKIKISTQTETCPLCHKPLESDDRQQDLKITYPDFRDLKNQLKFYNDLIAISAIILIAICIVVNTITWDGRLWCVIASVYILYAWLLGSLTFKKRVHLGLKLMMHAIFIPLTLVVVNAFGYRSTFSHVTWAISYTMPIIFSAFIVTLNILILKLGKSRREYIIYQLTLCVISFIPLILVLSGLAEPILPSAIVAGCSLLTIIGLIVFARRLIQSEFNRKFHM